MKNLFFRRDLNVVLMLAIFLSVFVIPAYSRENDAACVFVSLDNSAWIIHKDTQVKSTLKVGDLLKEGDHVVVLRGNKVQLAFDKNCKNMVQIDGDSSFVLDSMSPARIQLEKGKIFSLMDGLAPGSKFSVETPTAVAAVRGTQFQVNTTGIQSNVMTYRGEVAVSGRDASGALNQIVLVGAGQKTSIAAAGQDPSDAASMDATEKEEIAGVVQNIEQTRQTVKSGDIEAWISQEKQVGPDYQAAEDLKKEDRKSVV